jgi:hypothetical protein
MFARLTLAASSRLEEPMCVHSVTTRFEDWRSIFQRQIPQCSRMVSTHPSCIHVTILTWKPEARPLAGRSVSPSQGARFAKPAGIMISVSLAEHV